MLCNNPDGLAHVQVPPHEGSKGFAAVLSLLLAAAQSIMTGRSKDLTDRQVITCLGR